MSHPLRRLLARFRRGLEGMFFFLVLPIFFLRHLLQRNASPDFWKRWRRYLLDGLGDFRRAWWLLLQMEPVSTVLRYLLLIEWRLTTNSPAQVGVSSPGSGEWKNRPDLRMLVVTPGHLGDVLQMVPAMTALRKGKPHAHITWLVGPWSEGLARRYPVADQVMAVVPALSQYQRAAGDQKPTVWDEYRWSQQVGPGRYDVLITTTTTDPWVLYLSVCIQPTAWIGMLPGWDRYRDCAEDVMLAYEPDVYEAESLLRIPKILDCHGTPALIYKVQEAERMEARRVLEENGLKTGRPFLALAPGSGWMGKNWPVDRFFEVCSILSSRYHMPIVILGAPEERDLASQIGAGKTECPHLINLCGKTSLWVSVAILAEASMLLGNDSGLLHFAAALGVPTVALFGPTRPAKWAPRGDRHRALRAVDGCPCISWHPRAQCSQDHACMKAIRVDTVVEVIEDQLNRRYHEDILFSPSSR